MSVSTLHVAAISLNTKQSDVTANLAAVGRAIEYLPAETDLVVLPELFSTGFVSEAAELDRLAETNTGRTMRTINELAQRYNIAVAGSFLARSGSHFYNRGFFVEPSGDDNFYDKRHLFLLSPEAQTYSQGESKIPIIRFRGWNIAMIICYDLRFPVWSRNKDNAYDVLLVPANWPNARGYAWQHLLIARAIENQVYVIGANRSGSDKFGDYNSLTYILDPMGTPIGNLVPRRSADHPIVLADFSRDTLTNVREKLPVSRSADPFTLASPL